MEKELAVLQRKIQGQFTKKTLLGDIPIDDDEFGLLIKHFREKCRLFLTDRFPVDDQLYTIALIQIGIRYYDGGYWLHVANVLNVRTLSPQQQANLSAPFIRTLKTYNKKMNSEHEYVNSILLHCFVSNHYIKNLLDYLYRFYSIDIQRDLQSEMYKPALNFLIDVIRKQEDDDEHMQSNRSYILRKQTIDGIRHSSKQSISMKFRWLLKTIDHLWFGEPINQNSKSRLIKEVTHWFSTSELRRDVQRASSTERKRNERQSSSPFIHYNYKENTFKLIIPEQSFILRSNESVQLSCLVNGVQVEPDFGCRDDSTLLRTTRVEIDINNSDIFGEIHVLFVTSKGNRQFTVTTGEPIVFFDHRYNSTHIYNKKQVIIDGLMYAHMLNNTDLKVFGPYDSETLGNTKRLNFYLGAYDYIVLNQKKLFTIKANIEDGLSEKGLVHLATSDSLPIYNEKPLLFIRITESKISGSSICVNSRIYRLSDMEPTIAERYPDGSIQIILSLADVVKESGEYNILVDVPGLSVREYKFVYLPGFNFEFENAPFIFENLGFISFSDREVKGEYEGDQNVYNFEINEDTKILKFTKRYGAKEYPIVINVPVFKWSKNEANYSTRSLDQIWHSDFPYSLDVKFNDAFRIIIDDHSEEERYITANQIEFGQYHCDLTKFKTWLFDSEFSPVQISIEYKNRKYPFVQVHTKTEITSMSPLSYDETDKCITGHFEKYGLDNIYLSITHVQTNKEICKYILVENNDFKIKASDLAGDYLVELFTKRKGFGETYTSIYRMMNRLVTNNLEGLCFSVIGHYANERFQVSRFTHPHRIFDVKRIEPDIYVGRMTKVVREAINDLPTLVTKDLCKVKFKIQGIDKVGWQADIQILDEEDETDCFLYDRFNKELVVIEDPELTRKQCYVRYSDLPDRTFDLVLYKPEAS